MQDGTLALTKGNLTVPKDTEDFVLYNKSVPAKLQELESEGYKIVIFRLPYAYTDEWHSALLIVQQGQQHSSAVLQRMHASRYSISLKD